MQAEATFSQKTIRAKTVDFPKIFRPARLFQGIRQLIKEIDWDKSISKWEKYINRFSWIFIIVAAVYLIPVCLKIFLR